MNKLGMEWLGVALDLSSYRLPARTVEDLDSGPRPNEHKQTFWLLEGLSDETLPPVQDDPLYSLLF